MVAWGAAQVGSRNKVEEVREVLYLLAVGCFRSQDYERSRSLCTQVLEVGGMGSFFSGLSFFMVLGCGNIVSRRRGAGFESGLGN